MTEKGSIVEESTELMTTTETTHQAATGSDLAPSSSRGIDFYFQCVVVVIGVVGTAANALILYALVVSKQHKKLALIVNQNALDLASCVFLVITYSVKLCNIPLTGILGHWLCLTTLNDTIVWWGIIGSKFGLAILTADRYLKVVHSAWSKKKIRSWMIYLAMVFPWIMGLVWNATLAANTSAVIDGVCYYIWKNPVDKITYEIWHFVICDVIILSIIIFCYWHILAVIRHQASVMESHSGPGPSTAQIQSSKIQTNVIKTMILICAFFVVTNVPVDVYFLLENISESWIPLGNEYYALLFLLFFYSSTNPFIYAIKFDPVKRTLLGLIPCKISVAA